MSGRGPHSDVWVTHITHRRLPFGYRRSMIVGPNVEVTPRSDSGKTAALRVAKVLWDALLVLVCIAIFVVLAIALLHGEDLGA